MAKAPGVKTLPDPDPRDVQITSMEAQLQVLHDQLEKRTGELGEVNRENGRVHEIAKQWKAVAEERERTVVSLRDQCAVTERRLVELTGYTQATLETLERMEGVTAQPAAPAEPLRRRLPDRHVDDRFGRTGPGDKAWWRV